jgi:hypothetical protein
LIFIPGSGEYDSYCAPSLVARSSNARASSVPVRLASLIVEAVTDLVADHRADCAVIHCVIRVDVEERRLKNAGWKRDFVVGRAVLRVDRLRKHVPAPAFHRLSKTPPHFGVLKLLGAHHVAY